MRQALRSISSTLYFLFFICAFSQAQVKPTIPDTVKPIRIMYLVDVSSSMLYDWQTNEARMKVVGRLINDLTDSLIFYNPKIDFGLRLIGSEYPAQNKVCTDTKLEVPFGTYNSVSLIKHKANTLKPYGFTPIAYALEQTATYDFVNSSEFNYSIILITDGGESCNGDICAIMQQMLTKKISFKPYILSLVKDKILEDQYSCLGNYINILEQKDFNIAINKIISENKTKLNIKKDIPTIVTTTPTKPSLPNTDTIKKVVVAPKPTPKIDSPKVVNIPKVDTPKPVVVTPKPVVDTPKPTIVIPELKEEQRWVIKRGIRKYTLINVERSKPRNFPMPIHPIEPFDPNALAAVDPTPVKPIEVKPTPKPADVKPAPKPTEVKPTPVVKPNPITSKPNNNDVKDVPSPPKEMEIKTELTASDKTQLRVRFITKAGKEIFTEPVLKITNKKSKAVRSERRLVTAGSKAITPITIEPGLYNITIGNSSDYTKDVEIVPNQLNTVIIQINPSSLEFQYQNNASRPVKEYVALVSDRFSSNRTNTKQPCDTKVYYEPASYHVEVNTLPPSMYFLDLEFGVTKLITIPENGTIAFTNTNRVGRVELFYQLGDAYKFFYKMDILGQVNNQKLELLPGNYQVRYISPVDNQPKTYLFRITSLKQTSVEL